MNGGKDTTTTLAPGQHWEPEELMFLLLELLPPGESAAMEAHLYGAGTSGPDASAVSTPGADTGSGTAEGCALCRAELAAVRADLGLYALEAAPMEDAPARSRERLVAAMAAEPVKQTFTHDSGGHGLGLLTGGKADTAAKSLTRVPTWLGWAVAAAVALVAVHFYQAREALRGTLAEQQGQIAHLSGEQARAREIVNALTDRSAQRVTLTLTKAPAPVQPTGRATYLAGKGTLIFLASHLAPLPSGKTYELWVIPANGSAPVPAGTFRPDERGSASLVTANLSPGLEAKAFGVTIEAGGGSSTPTLPIVLAGS